MSLVMGLGMGAVLDCSVRSTPSRKVAISWANIEPVTSRKRTVAILNNIFMVLGLL
jgi:hypothetical protein